MTFAFPLSLTCGALDLRCSSLTGSGVYDQVLAPYRKKNKPPFPLLVCVQKSTGKLLGYVTALKMSRKKCNKMHEVNVSQSFCQYFCYLS